jgi:hypothetical protein
MLELGECSMFYRLAVQGIGRDYQALSMAFKLNSTPRNVAAWEIGTSVNNHTFLTLFHSRWQGTLWPWQVRILSIAR